MALKTASSSTALLCEEQRWVMRQEDFKRRAVPVLHPVTAQSTDLEPPCRWAISLSTSHGPVLNFYGKPLF